MNKNKLKTFAIDNAVTILFIVICIIGIILSGQSMAYILGEISTRFFRNIILILSLLVPVWAGLGLNFSIVLGAMAAQTGIIIVNNFFLSGPWSLVLAWGISIPLSIVLGTLTGRLFNKTKGQEMITGMILGFFAQGIYELIFLYMCGPIIPIKNQTLLLTNKIGLITPINLDEKTAGSINGIWRVNLYKALPVVLVVLGVWLFISSARKAKSRNRKLKINDFIGTIVCACCLVAFYLVTAVSRTVKFAFTFTQVPVVTALIAVAVCIYITFLGRTKLGSDINAVGQDRNIAEAMGINSDKIRISAVVISTILAALGQVIYLQEIGNFQTYTAHTNVGTYAIAALLVGGASIRKASIGQATLGAILFHTMFVVVPLAAKNVLGEAALGEYFRVFACYAVIAASLALHAWKTKKEIEAEQSRLEEEKAKIAKQG